MDVLGFIAGNSVLFFFTSTALIILSAFLAYNILALRKKYMPVIDLDAAINQKEKELKRKQGDTESLSQDYLNKRQVYQSLLEQIKIYEDDLELIAEGFEPPVFSYSDPESYKEKITEVINKQKELAKAKKVVILGTSWTINGSKQEGKRFMAQASKLAARSFNNEANAIIKNVSWRNFDSSLAKIEKSFDYTNKYNESNHINISREYLNLKILELTLTYEHQLKLQEQKEEIAEAKRAIREEERLQSDLIKSQKEEDKYAKLLEKARKEAESKAGADLEKLNEQIALLSEQLEEAHKANQRALSMAQQTRSGFVYVISNIGSFGENIYKIGMTRRLEPMDRVKELSGASVPFTFDTHAMIYSTDAPALEAKLHNRFTEKRVNMANFRKEYFKVSLDEIEEEVGSLGVDYEFFRTPEAEEYRKTLAIRNQLELKREEVAEAFPEFI